MGLAQGQLLRVKAQLLGLPGQLHILKMGAPF